MDGPVSSLSHPWLSTTPRPICNFFAMGGCNKGDRCPFSHELVQVAPKGVDVTNGFYISGKVANYKAAPAVTSLSSPDSGRKSDDAGNASSADGLSTLASPSSYSVTGVSLSAEAKEWVGGGDSGGGLVVVSWGASATASTTSVKSQCPIASPMTRTVTTSPPQFQVPPPPPPQQQQQQQQKLLCVASRPQQQQCTQPPQSQQQTTTSFQSQQPQQSPRQLQQELPPPPQPTAPLPPQPRSVANARHTIPHPTGNPTSANHYAAPQTVAQPAAAPPTAVVGKYSITYPAIQPSVNKSITTATTSATAVACNATSVLPFSTAASLTPFSPMLPSSVSGPGRREDEAVPSVAPTAPPRYTASSKVFSSSTTTTATPLPNVSSGRFLNAVFSEPPMGTGTLATRNETPARPIEAPLPRSRETNAEHTAFAASKYSPVTMSMPNTKVAAAATSVAPPQYETKAVAPATTAGVASAVPSGQTRVMLPAPRSQQQQQHQQHAQSRAPLQTQQSQMQMQHYQQPTLHQQPPHDTQFHHHAPQHQLQQRQFTQQQPQHPQLRLYQVPNQQVHMPLSPPQQPQTQQQQQQDPQVFIMTPPRTTAATTQPCESPTAAPAPPQLPCGYSFTYAVPANVASPTQVIISEQPNTPRPAYTVLTSSSPHVQQPQPQPQSFPQSKNAVLYLAQAPMTAANTNAAALDSSVPHFILVKPDGTFTVLQTAF